MTEPTYKPSPVCPCREVSRRTAGATLQASDFHEKASLKIGALTDMLPHDAEQPVACRLHLERWYATLTHACQREDPPELSNRRVTTWGDSNLARVGILTSSPPRACSGYFPRLSVEPAKYGDGEFTDGVRILEMIYP